MKCDETRPLLEAYLDGELDLVHSLSIEQHVQSCPVCRAHLDALQTLRDRIRATLPREAAPAGLPERVRGALRRESRTVLPFPTRWLAAAAAVAVTLGILLLTRNARMSGPEPIVAEAVANHVRSLLPGHLMDVESTDRHTVKPWVAQRVDYSPPVLDFADAGFPLLGARLDYLGNRTVAALVYTRREHRINVFVLPATAPEAERWATRDGFHVVVWSEAAMRFVIVSDLAEPELREFSEKFRAGVK